MYIYLSLLVGFSRCNLNKPFGARIARLARLAVQVDMEALVNAAMDEMRTWVSQAPRLKPPLRGAFWRFAAPLLFGPRNLRRRFVGEGIIVAGKQFLHVCLLWFSGRSPLSC